MRGVSESTSQDSRILPVHSPNMLLLQYTPMHSSNSEVPYTKLFEELRNPEELRKKPLT